MIMLERFDYLLMHQALFQILDLLKLEVAKWVDRLGWVMAQNG